MEPNEIKFTPDYKANEPIFWGVFKELSKNNNGLVAYDKLQEGLLSTGKFYAAETVLGFFGFDRIVYSDHKGNNRRRKWYEELREQRVRDIETEML